MTRQTVWIGVAVLALAVLASAWFLHNFEQVPVTRREAASAQARRDPYLALERFLARMGRPVTRVGNAGVLEGLAPGDVLILDRNRRRALDGERQQRLLAWVEAGGYLLVNAEFPGVDDPLLEGLDVGWRSRASLECPAGDDAATAEADEDAVPDLPREPPWVAAQIPGSAKPLALDVEWNGLEAGEPPPAWRVDRAGQGATLLHFERGRGHVTVLADLAQLADNWRIGRRDHAEVIWTLLRHYRPEGRVWLASRLEVLTLGRWLLESGWMVLTAAALLLAAWLARIVPRFGGLAPAPGIQRRSLREHLAAMGRFVTRAGGSAWWLETARGALLARLALRHPALAALPAAEKRNALARIARLPPEDVRHALEGRPRGRAAFTEAIATLQKLELRL